MENSGGGPGADALDGREGPRRSGRRQQAGFSIFLDQVADDSGRAHWETRLYHAESGSETSLIGASPDEWIAWLLERIGLEEIRRDDERRGASPATMGVASVEILDVHVTDETVERSESVHTITARVVVQLTGVSGVEQAIGSKILRGLAVSEPGRRQRRPPDS